MDSSHDFNAPAERPGVISEQMDLLGVVGAVDAGEDLQDHQGDADAFDWLGDTDIILHEQIATAIYRNRAGAVVIRQERGPMEDRDEFVVLRDREAVKALIAALQRELRGMSDG